MGMCIARKGGGGGGRGGGGRGRGGRGGGGRGGGNCLHGRAHPAMGTEGGCGEEQKSFIMKLPSPCHHHAH